MSDWRVEYVEGETFTDLTDWVRLPELAASVSGAPVEQALALTLYTKGEPFAPAYNAQIRVIDGSDEIQYRGYISAIERTDATGAQVAGIEDAESYKIVAQSIMARLKTVAIPNQTDPELQATQELPPGLRANQSGAALDTSPMFPSEVLAWAVQLINDLESVKDVGLEPIGFDPLLVLDPTTQVPAEGGGLEDFVFTSAFAFFADNATYYELIDSIANLSGLRWWIDGELRLHTIDAIEPPILNYEISDDPSAGPVVIESGHTVVGARSLTMTEDITAIVNSVQASYEPTDGTVVVTKIQNPYSVALYGDRWETITTSYRTKEMARAVARRRVNTAGDPDYRGSARVRYTTHILPGHRCWVKQVRHGKDYLATVFGVRPVFETGIRTPVWLDVEFSREDWQPPSFTPLVFGAKVTNDASSGGTKGLADTSGDLGSGGAYILATATNDYAISAGGGFITIGVS